MPGSTSSWHLTLAVLSATSAVAVSILYLPQSMLTNIASSLAVEPRVATAVATAVQVGYAVGIFLCVPLAARVHPRRQVTVQSLLLASAMLVSAVLPDIAALAVGFLAVGLVANIAQILIPVANRLSPPARRGSTIGAIAGALMVGIFGGRIGASSLVDTIGWRWVLVVFAGLVLLTVPFARHVLKGVGAPARVGRPYGLLLMDTLRTISTSSVVVPGVIQFFVFATFNSMWTVMVVHLTGEPFAWSVSQAGLFGIVGLLAGLVTPFSSYAIDQFGQFAVTAAGLVILLTAAASATFDAHLAVAFGVTMFVVTLTNQTIQSATQTRVLDLNPRRGPEANTMFMVFVFLGGSAGAVLGPIAFHVGGMQLVAVQGVALSTAALATCLVDHFTGRRPPRVHSLVDHNIE